MFNTELFMVAKNRNSYIHANQTGIEYHAAFIKNTGIKMSKHIKWGE